MPISRDGWRLGFALRVCEFCGAMNHASADSCADCHRRIVAAARPFQDVVRERQRGRSASPRAGRPR